MGFMWESLCSVSADVIMNDGIFSFSLAWVFNLGENVSDQLIASMTKPGPSVYLY